MLATTTNLNICLETKEEKHYDDYTSEDFIKAGIAKNAPIVQTFVSKHVNDTAQLLIRNGIMLVLQHQPTLTLTCWMKKGRDILKYIKSL